MWALQKIREIKEHGKKRQDQRIQKPKDRRRQGQTTNKSSMKLWIKTTSRDILNLEGLFGFRAKRINCEDTMRQQGQVEPWLLFENSERQLLILRGDHDTSVTLSPYFIHSHTEGGHTRLLFPLWEILVMCFVVSEIFQWRALWCPLMWEMPLSGAEDPFCWATTPLLWVWLSPLCPWGGPLKGKVLENELPVTNPLPLLSWETQAFLPCHCHVYQCPFFSFWYRLSPLLFSETKVLLFPSLTLVKIPVTFLPRGWLSTPGGPSPGVSGQPCFLRAGGGHTYWQKQLCLLLYFYLWTVQFS